MLTAIGVWLASSLALRSDLTELLPRNFESVQNVEKLKAKLGGMGYVVVVGSGAEPEKLRRFANDAAAVLEKMPGIRFVEYRRSGEFFTDRALYYLSVEDLTKVEERLEERIRWERRQKLSALSLDDEEPPPSLDISDIEAKYRTAGARKFANTAEEYLLDPEARMVVVLAKPEGTSADLGYSKALLGQVRDALHGIDLKQYGPDFQVELTGTFQKKVDQQNQIARDIGVSSGVAALIILAYLLFHFRSPMAIALCMIPAGAGLMWTYGFTSAVYGSVNLLTGFLGAILGGLGVEHGIHLLGRFNALKGEGKTSEEAVLDTFEHTGSSALISAMVAALTFASLAISDFRAFREFGVIAAVGMLILVLGYFLVLPPLFALSERFGWKPRPVIRPGSTSPAVRRLIQWKWPITGAFGCLLVVALTQFPRLNFNFNFGALQDASLPSFVLDKKVNEIRGYSQTPVIILVPSPEDEKGVVAELIRRREAKGTASTIDFVTSLRDLVPSQQAEKKEILNRISERLSKVNPEKLDAKLRGPFEMLRRATQTEPFTADDLPPSIRQQFAGAETSHLGMVLVFPAIDLSDGKLLRVFSDEVSDLPLPSGGRVAASGEAMVLADIIRMVSREAPRVLLAATLSALLAMWLMLGSIRSALLCMTPTVLSLVALLGLMPLVSEEFNYLNILIVPVLIGTTVDAGVHLVSRLSEEDDFAAAVLETGRAITGGLITSAIGFGTLLMADHPGLNSVGRLANLGFAVNLLFMVIAFPAFYLVVSRKKPVVEKSPREGDLRVG